MTTFFPSSRPTRRRFIADATRVAGSLTAAGAFLNSCNASGNTTSSGKTKLTIMYFSNELTPAHIKEFEKLHSDITINYIAFDQNRLNAMFAAGTPPDFVRGIGFDSPNNSARGIALNLDPYIEKSTVLKKSDFMPVQDLWRWDGKQAGQGAYYGLAKDWSPDGTLWCNTARFAQAGISSPSATDPMTYDQLLDMGNKLTVKQGGKVQVYGIDPQWASSPNIIQMIRQQDGIIYRTDLTQADFTTPEAQKALQWYVAYAQAHIGPSPFDPDPNGWDGPTYLANRLAVSQFGYWFGGEISSGSKDVTAHAFMAPAPLMGPKRISACFTATGAWIPASAKNKDAAWSFMEYFMAGTPAHERAKSGWGVPSLKSLLPEMPQSSPYQKQAYQVLQNEQQYFEVLPVSPYTTSAAMNPIFDKYLQQAVRNQLSVGSAAQQITADINKLLQQGKQAMS